MVVERPHTSPWWEQLIVTHGVLAANLLRAARTLDREDGTDVLCQLLDAVS